MSKANVPAHGLLNIGNEALPLFAVTPSPLIFEARAKRFRDVAEGSPLAAYLTFLARLSDLQHDAQTRAPAPSLPAAEDMQQALDNGMPPLPAAGLALDDLALEAVERLLCGVTELAAAPAATQTAAKLLLETDTDARRAILADALTTAPSPEQIAQRVLVLAGLQVHFVRLASQLDQQKLKPIADGVCPACGSAPVSSSVVGWPKAHNMRFCSCSLCGTMWNVVRIKCVLCSSTEGIRYHTVEGAPETVKAESCDGCRRYVKILYQVKDHVLNPVADDVASLGLDMLMVDEGWLRGGSNPFLLGY
jgi:FdhE protein